MTCGGVERCGSFKMLLGEGGVGWQLVQDASQSSLRNCGEELLLRAEL